jgi:hypothetical protein
MSGEIVAPTRWRQMAVSTRVIILNSSPRRVLTVSIIDMMEVDVRQDR